MQPPIRQRRRPRCRPQLESLEGRLNPGGLFDPFSLTPAALWVEYHINPLLDGGLDGHGQTIAIVDAYDDPNINSDLKAFDSFLQLSDPPSFTVVNQDGGSQLPGTDPTGGWEQEEALDVEYAHSIALGANIVLVECNSNSQGDLATGVDWAATHGASVVSMSFGSTGDWAFNRDFSPTTYPNVTFVASAGDNGSVSGGQAESPSRLPNVLAVGGTTIQDSAYFSSIGYLSGDSYSETAWGSTGGGVSNQYAQPLYQQQIPNRPSTTGRMAPDVAFDADPASPVNVYNTYGGAHFFLGLDLNWEDVGGTSLSAPCWAGLIAIADQIRAPLGLPALSGGTQTLPALYEIAANPNAYAHDFHDITSGGNGTYNAGTGYDLVTGLGTPDAANLLPDLSRPPYRVSSPSNVLADAGLSAVFTAGSDSPNTTVQWQAKISGGRFFDILGATGTEFTISDVSAYLDGYTFRAVFTDNFGYQIITDPARLTVDSVTSNPSNQTINYGQSATFTAASSNQSGSDTIQWQVDTGSGFSNILGATSSTLTLTNPSVTQDGSRYRAAFTNSAGTFYSNAATLHVKPVLPTLSVVDGGGMYNGKPFAATATALGLDGQTTVRGFFTYSYTDSLGHTSATAPVNASSYTVVATFTSNDPNYTGGTAQTTFTITQAPLTITADNKTKIQGEANPTFTVNYSGFVLGDGPNVLGGALSFSTPATSSSSPGSYDIVPSGLTSGNYAITFVKGTLTVISYSQATTNLQALVDAAGLAHGMLSSLDSELQAALASFNAGDTGDGASQLRAFINHVAAQRGKQIGATLADRFIASAQRIINAVR
jgi:hypothetical protein